MATVVDKQFDISRGAVMVQVSDLLNRISAHTIYVLGPSGPVDVDAAIAGILTNADAAAAATRAAFEAAGWTPPHGS